MRRSTVRLCRKIGHVPWSLLGPLSLWLQAGSAGASAPVTPDSLGGTFPRIVCVEDTTITYALYLPRGYSPDRRWPILYCFDPAGRGMVPLELFRAAAERQGFIIASTHGLSSLTWNPEATGTILSAVWNDTQRRLRIDLARVYAAGFSGGGRIAWLLDSITRDVAFAGIIEVGAGLPWSEFPADYQPSDLAFCGLCGRVDFNYYEMLDLKRTMEGTTAATRFRVFDGGHAWPPEIECRRALAWMDVLAVGQGRLASDSLILSDYFASELADARAAREAGHWVDVVEILESLVRSFGGIQGWGLSDAIRELDEIRGSEAYEHQRTHRDRLDIGGRTRIGRAAGLLDSLAEGGRSERLPSQVDLLRSLGLSPGAGTGPISAEAYDEALTERRVVEAVYVRAASVLPTRLLQRGDLRRAVLLLRMAVALAPDRPAVWYNLAAAQSRSGDRSQAIESLGRAIAFGFEDADRMRSDPDLAAVRSSPEFERLLQGIRKP